jgi:hypothetical protein
MQIQWWEGAVTANKGAPAPMQGWAKGKQKSKEKTLDTAGVVKMTQYRK